MKILSFFITTKRAVLHIQVQTHILLLSFFWGEGAVLVACGNSWDRDRTCATTATPVAAMKTLDP